MGPENTSDMGRTDHFFDGGNSARLNNVGAMMEDPRMEGPRPLELPEQKNPLAAFNGVSN